MALERSTIRRARKAHPCGDAWCERTIQPGEIYLEHITSPGHELLDNQHWMRLRECGPCLTQRTGRTVEESRP